MIEKVERSPRERSLRRKNPRRRHGTRTAPKNLINTKNLLLKSIPRMENSDRKNRKREIVKKEIQERELGRDMQNGEI